MYIYMYIYLITSTSPQSPETHPFSPSLKRQGRDQTQGIEHCQEDKGWSVTARTLAELLDSQVFFLLRKK